MKIQQAILKAVEGGYKLKGYEKYEQKVVFIVSEEVQGKVTKYNPYWVDFRVTTTKIEGKPFISNKRERVEYIFLDPLFYQCYFRQKSKEENGVLGNWDESVIKKAALEMNVNLIYHIHDGGTAESFFEEL